MPVDGGTIIMHDLLFSKALLDTVSECKISRLVPLCRRKFNCTTAQGYFVSQLSNQYRHIPYAVFYPKVSANLLKVQPISTPSSRAFYIQFMGPVRCRVELSSLMRRAFQPCCWPKLSQAPQIPDFRFQIS